MQLYAISSRPVLVAPLAHNETVTAQVIVHRLARASDRETFIRMRHDCSGWGLSGARGNGRSVERAYFETDSLAGDRAHSMPEASRTRSIDSSSSSWVNFLLMGRLFSTQYASVILASMVSTGLIQAPLPATRSACPPGA